MDLNELERRFREIKEIRNNLKKGDMEELNRVRSEYPLGALEVEKLKQGRGWGLLEFCLGFWFKLFV